MLTGKVDRLHHIDLESFPGTESPQGLHVSASTSAEPMVVPDHQLPHRTAVEQNLPHEALGSQAGQLTIEPQEKYVIKR
jgi:hypothetical protein